MWEGGNLLSCGSLVTFLVFSHPHSLLPELVGPTTSTGSAAWCQQPPPTFHSILLLKICLPPAHMHSVLFLHVVSIRGAGTLPCPGRSVVAHTTFDWIGNLSSCGFTILGCIHLKEEWAISISSITDKSDILIAICMTNVSTFQSVLNGLGT